MARVACHNRLNSSDNSMFKPRGRLSYFLFVLPLLYIAFGLMATHVHAQSAPPKENQTMSDTLVRTDAEWRELLTPEQYRVLREKGTDRAFTSPYYETKQAGVYVCAACGQELFSSDEKYDSGSGWPSFYQPIDGLSSNKVDMEKDHTMFMVRTEVHCSRCGGHLGHVFDDGPKPTGKRYCINGTSLKLEPKEGDEGK